MDYTEALRYLAELTRFGINLGLSRIKELLARLGNPQDHLKVAHIGGTNGKGSTGAMLASVFQSAGYRVGLFTSPHLHSYCERMRINGQSAPEDRVADLLSAMRRHLDDMVEAGLEHPTEFEVTTALAFWYFYQEQVDLLVLEVGMGGAIDSTNVVTPLVSVITNVSLDHTEYLGETVAAIAKVKSGIVKPGVPLVTAAEGEALQVLREECEKCGSSLILVGQDLTWRQHTMIATGQRFTLVSREEVYEDLWLPLLGRHQVVNCAAALGAAEVLANCGLTFEPEHLRRGLADTRWPGRLELLEGEVPVLLDGAHNYAGICSLGKALQDHFPERDPIFVVGILDDKEQEKMIQKIADMARTLIITKPDHPRSTNWHLVGHNLAPRDSLAVHYKENTTEALETAFSAAKAQDLICVTGSLFLVAEMREKLLSRVVRRFV